MARGLRQCSAGARNLHPVAAKSAFSLCCRTDAAGSDAGVAPPAPPGTPAPAARAVGPGRARVCAAKRPRHTMIMKQVIDCSWATSSVSL